jgi:hypothetical protein
VEVIDVTGAALEWVQLAIFVVALGLGLVVLVVTWLAVQAWRR